MVCGAVRKRAGGQKQTHADDKYQVTAVIFGFFAIKRMRARSVFLPETIVVAQSAACMGARLPDIWSRSVRP